MRLTLFLVVLTAAAVFFVASFAAPARRSAASWGTLAPDQRQRVVGHVT